jgi:hypothetical protein
LATAVEQTHPRGFSCAEVQSLLVEACDESHVALPQNNGIAIDSLRTNPTPAAAASVDLIALLEHLAHGPTCDGSPHKNAARTSEIAKAAARVLALIGRPTLPSSHDSRTQLLEYGGQYRKITGFGPSSPFVVEAQRVDPGAGVHFGGLGILWGNPYDLLFRENGRSLFDTYRALPFEAHTGWTRMLAACIDEAEACRTYEPPPDEPISRGPCANF